MVITPTFILVIIALYFVVLLGISKITSKTQSATDFYIAGRKSPWYIVAFGMIGASLSGVTFISIPGAVGAGGLNMQFAYMQMVFGYLVGYLIIATVLMPIYYKMNSITIYQYLEERPRINLLLYIRRWVEDDHMDGYLADIIYVSRCHCDCCLY